MENTTFPFQNNLFVSFSEKREFSTNYNLAELTVLTTVCFLEFQISLGFILFLQKELSCPMYVAAEHTVRKSISEANTECTSGNSHSVSVSQGLHCVASELSGHPNLQELRPLCLNTQGPSVEMWPLYFLEYMERAVSPGLLEHMATPQTNITSLRNSFQSPGKILC